MEHATDQVGDGGSLTAQQELAGTALDGGPGVAAEVVAESPIEGLQQQVNLQGF